MNSNGSPIWNDYRIAWLQGWHEALPMALMFARVSWVVATCSILASSDLGLTGMRYFQQVTLYGKLSSLRGPEKLWLDHMSISSSAAWTFFYVVGAALTSASLCAMPSKHLAFLLLHLSRRLYECIFITRFSRRTMHPLQALVGLGFYVLLPSSLLLEALAATVPPPASPAVIAGLVGFAVSSMGQHAFHRHLASLGSNASVKAYGLPRHWMFSRISTSPHYTCEVLLYTSLCLLEGGSPSSMFALAFTTANLSVTAVRTRRWYAEKFGEANVPCKSCIIPGVL